MHLRVYLFLILTTFFSCQETQKEERSKAKTQIDPGFGKVAFSLASQLESITPKLLPHNPNISVDQYYLTDISTPAEPCMLELKIYSSEQTAQDPWVEERSYKFSILGLDSVIGDQYVTLFFNGLNSAIGSAYTEYRNRESNTRDVRLFYREDFGYYFLIYAESNEHAVEIAQLFNQLKTVCN